MCETAPEATGRPQRRCQPEAERGRTRIAREGLRVSQHTRLPAGWPQGGSTFDRIQFHPVHLGRADRIDVRPDRLYVSFPPSQEIQVPCRPVRMGGPDPQEHCPLQHETVAEGRSPQPIEETLGGEPRQEHLVIVAGLFGQIEEACQHGCGRFRMSLALMRLRPGTVASPASRGRSGRIGPVHWRHRGDAGRNP